ncbi:MAG: stage V sporulation protein AE [Sulfobacillus acidophilus]|uniref:Stage V sporulation protein AE n=1 Tax=Sulfobacillus acidophilus TaxID=53633 RepID=A0A2T2WKS4_9FIRM|nr:MAG: stage V sporulation protein AE [Sulfobacillus acidophilus]
MSAKKRVIIVTDGDETAYHALSLACKELHCHPLAASAGNPTPLNGPELLEAVRRAPADPVVVMVDDRGDADRGRGEQALTELTGSPEIEVLGVVAVAANTRPVDGVAVDRSVDQHGDLVRHAVNKKGRGIASDVLKGDTVDVLADYAGPIVGLGDPGKMQGHDAIKNGVPATRRAIEEILRREVERDGRR